MPCDLICIFNYTLKSLIIRMTIHLGFFKQIFSQYFRYLGNGLFVFWNIYSVKNRNKEILKKFRRTYALCWLWQFSCKIHIRLIIFKIRINNQNHKIHISCINSWIIAFQYRLIINFIACSYNSYDYVCILIVF